MSETNGNGDGKILSLDQAARRPLGKSGDWLTRGQAEQMIKDALASELPKIHEFYLNQIPPFVARMIQDALMSFGLIQLTPEAAAVTDIAPDSIAPAVSENAPAVADIATDGGDDGV